MIGELHFTLAPKKKKPQIKIKKNSNTADFSLSFCSREQLGAPGTPRPLRLPGEHGGPHPCVGN